MIVNKYWRVGWRVGSNRFCGGGKSPTQYQGSDASGTKKEGGLKKTRLNQMLTGKNKDKRFQHKRLVRGKGVRDKGFTWGSF